MNLIPVPDSPALRAIQSCEHELFRGVDPQALAELIEASLCLVIAPGEHAPRWRYGVYRATQQPALRQLRAQVTSARRALQARGRRR